MDRDSRSVSGVRLVRASSGLIAKTQRNTRPA
jgi:hypothetical protein